MQKENLFASGMGLRTPLVRICTETRPEVVFWSLLEDPGGTRHPAANLRGEGGPISRHQGVTDPVIGTTVHCSQIYRAGGRVGRLKREYHHDNSNSKVSEIKQCAPNNDCDDSYLDVQTRTWLILTHFR